MKNVGSSCLVLMSCAVLYACLLSDAARAASVTLGALKDTSIFSNNTGNTGGGNDVIYVGKNNSGATRRALIEFDVNSAIPAGSTINSATLTLYLNGFTGTSFGADRSVRLFRLTSDWGNGTTGSGGSSGGGGQGTAAVPGTGDVTWSHRFFSDTAWGFAGGDLTNSPTATTLISNTPTPVVVNSPYTWSSATMVADIQGWLDGVNPNDGWLIREALEATSGSLLLFYSKEIVDNPATTGIDESLLRPTLSIDYTPVPEPSTLALGGVAVVALASWNVRRERRS